MEQCLFIFVNSLHPKKCPNYENVQLKRSFREVHTDERGVFNSHIRVKLKEYDDSYYDQHCTKH